MNQLPLLSLQIWLPIIGAAFVLLRGDKQIQQARWIALFTVLVSLVLCWPLLAQFDAYTHSMQFEELKPWIPFFNMNYHLGVDGISLPFILLNDLTTLIVVLAAWYSVHKSVANYLAAFLVMQGLMSGVFASLDAMLFYVFWEATLIPMYLIIGIWGSDNRIYATIKFFLFTFFGSLLMLIAFLYLGFKANSFNILDFYPLKLGLVAQTLIFIGCFFAFAIKIPMWPVHTWLPDAHTEAPAGGSVVLAALMLKMGGYGFLRFNLPITPDASRTLDWILIALSLVAIIYIGLVALAQTDMKKLIAYSSIAHMGFVTLGTFMMFSILKHPHAIAHAVLGLEGAMIMMISHAFISGALFLGVGVLYDRLHTRKISDFGGVAAKMPIFAAFFMLFAMANTGLPGTSGFVGEFMVVLSSFKGNFWVTVLAATTLILSASYTLWMYKRVFFSELGSAKLTTLTDLNVMEILVFTILAALVLLLGIYPKPLLNMFHGSIQNLVEMSQLSKL